MKDLLRRLCSPLLLMFERGEGEYAYQASHRWILIAVGALFLVLSAGIASVIILQKTYGGLLPFIIFLGAGKVCLIVGTLGTDRAVAKIWGGSKERSKP